ncbi:transposable element Tcb2 transposase [Trichonephila clavipes]|nr:transposable element Tcb2 transposase [Trichonephila clavipes]
MLNGRTELHIFDRWYVTGVRYWEEVLLPQVRLFRGVIGPDFIFMDDNARPHWTLAVEELLESEDITRMDWPAYSPDLNPIEHVWDALGRRIAARLHHPENTQQLKQMLIEEWALLPQEMLHQLVLSMRRRCEVTIARGKNQLRLTDGAQRYHRKRVVGSQLQILTRRSRVELSEHHRKRSRHQVIPLLFNCRLLLAWHSRMRSARDQSSSLPIDVLGISLQRVPHVEAWRVGCHLSSPPCHSTGVPNDTVSIGRSTPQARKRRALRASESDEQRALRLENLRVHATETRSSESSDQREVRLETDREYVLIRSVLLRQLNYEKEGCKMFE